MIARFGVAELARKLRSREVSAREVAQAFLERIDRHDPRLGAFLTISPDSALEQADHAQKLLDQGDAPPLAGVPVAVKDNICTAGLRTTCASRVLENYEPPYDAHVVEALKANGCPILGKTNLDEFAMGTSCENSAFGPTKNPWDLDRVPGGSSGGSAAAVSAGLAPFALGSDTGGSVRMPAALCGVVGFKPTYGRVSRYGLVAFGSSLDQIGPFAYSVEDAALAASLLCSHDRRDATSLPGAELRVDEVRSGTLRGKKLGIVKETMTEAIEPQVRAVLENAWDLLREEGAELEEVSLPTSKFGVTTYYIIAPAEASSNLARFDGIRFGSRREGPGHIGSVARTRGELFGHEVKQRIMLGTYALSAGYYDAYYVRAQQVRSQMADEWASALENYDALVCPASPVVAFALGGLIRDQMAMKLLDFCTIPANMGGFPSISTPCGLAGGLPVGMLLTGARMRDEELLQLAYRVEQALPPMPPSPMRIES